MATVNGVPYDFASLELGVPGGPCIGLQSITHGLSVELEKLSGATREDYDRTPGLGHADDAEVECYESDYQRMVKTMGNGYMMQEFPATLSYANKGAALQTVEMKRCQIVKVSQNAQKGPSGLTRSMTWSVMKIKEFGLDPFNANG